MKRIVGPAVVAAVLLLAAMASAQETGESPADLSGVWNLDAGQSDDLAAELKSMHEKTQASRGARGGGRGGMGGGRRGGMGGRGGGMGAGSGGGRGAGKQPSEGSGQNARMPEGNLSRVLSQLLISTFDGNIEIVDGAETTRLWTPDGKNYRTRTPRGESTTRAWWEGDTLVLESIDPMRTATQRLRRTGDKQLQVIHSLSFESGATIKGTLVYQGA